MGEVWESEDSAECGVKLYTCTQDAVTSSADDTSLQLFNQIREVTFEHA
jgi:hypothetical protein